MNDIELANSNTFDEITDVEIQEATKPAEISFDELTDETISDEMIRELKAIGSLKPPKVSESKWAHLEDARGIHYHVINLAALGRNFSEIARETGLHINTVRKVLAKPEMRIAVRDKVEAFYAGDMKKQFSSLFGKSYSVVDEVLSSETEKGSTKLDAAKFVVEQTIGKAQQVVQHKGSLLIDVLDRVEKLRDATPTNLLDKPRDSMDDLIDEVIPSTLVIGKRGESDEAEGQ